jgi:hypothetical protein
VGNRLIAGVRALALSGVSRTLSDPPLAAAREFVERAHGARLAGEATPAIERICDRLADRLDARRAILPGRGHAVPRAEGFNELVDGFWTQAERG